MSEDLGIGKSKELIHCQQERMREGVVAKIGATFVEKNFSPISTPFWPTNSIVTLKHRHSNHHRVESLASNVI